MIPERTFEIRLIQHRQNDAIVQRAFAVLPPAQQRVAYAMVSTLHSRHVGITPSLAVGLARILVEASLKVDGYAEPWRAVMGRLQQTLRNLAEVADYQEHVPYKDTARLRLNASISYTTLRLVAPLINRACEQIGYTYLFCEDDNTSAVGETEYSRYEDLLREEIGRIAEHTTDYAIFWQERAIMLASLTLHRPRIGPSSMAQEHDEHRTLPNINPTDLGMFMRLKPELAERNERSHRQFQLAVRQQLRERQLPDPGADGIFVTRSPEDINRMLVSELLYPRLIRLDRMVNTGYFAIERPPKPVRLRDVLVVGLFPGAVDRLPSGTFVKTCWFEFLMHFSRLLKQSDLSESELRWIQGDSFQRMRAKSLMIQDLPETPVALDGNDMQAYRQNFLMKLGWMPSFLDEHAYFDSLPTLEAVEANSVRKRMDVWVQAAWQAQKENTYWSQKQEKGYRRKNILNQDIQTTFSRQSWDLDQFAFVHVMIFLPQSMQKAYSEEDEEAIAEFSAAHFRSLLKLKRRGGSSIGVMWVPSSAESSEWTLTGRPESSGDLAIKEKSTLDSIAGTLIEAWLDNIKKEIQHG